MGAQVFALPDIVNVPPGSLGTKLMPPAMKLEYAYYTTGSEVRSVRSEEYVDYSKKVTKVTLDGKELVKNKDYSFYIGSGAKSYCVLYIYGSAVKNEGLLKVVISADGYYDNTFTINVGPKKDPPDLQSITDNELGKDVHLKFSNADPGYAAQLVYIIIDDAADVYSGAGAGVLASDNTIVIESKNFAKAGAHKAEIRAEGYNNGVYNIQIDVPVPVAEPKGGSYDSSKEVKLTGYSTAKIYYTTDGTEPTAASKLYTAPITINETTTLLAAAIADGQTSKIMTEKYTVAASAKAPAKPVASPAGGNYSSEQTVTLTCSTAGAEIYYTTDNTKPTSSSKFYTSPISIKENTTLNAVAIKDNISSDVTTNSYSFTSGKTEMVFTLDEISYTVNGAAKSMDVAPVSIQDRTMLPIRYAAEPLGAKVDWDGTARKVTVTQNSTVLELWIDNSTAKVNGKDVAIDPENSNVKPIIVNNRTLLPMRFVTENLGCAVEWNAATRQIKITYPK